MQEQREFSNSEKNLYQRKIAYRTANMISVGTDWYFVFVFFSIVKSLSLLSLLFLTLKTTNALKKLFYCVAFCLAFCSYISDMLSVDALTKSDAQAKNLYKRSTINIILLTISCISYLLSAFANARFVPDLSEGIEDANTKFSLNLLGLALVSVLSIPYNHMFNDDSMRNTLNAVSSMYKNPRPYWEKFKKNKGACFEASYQALLINPTYRAIKDASAVITSFPLFFLIKPNSPITLVVAGTAAATTFLMTFFGRCQATFEKHIPKENEYVDIRCYYYSLHLSKRQKFQILFTSLVLRALPLGQILFWATSHSNLLDHYYLNYALGAFTALSIGALSHLALTEEALYAIARSELSKKDIAVSKNYYSLYGAFTSKDPVQQSQEQKFDAFAAEFVQNRPWVLSWVSGNNWLSRGSRFVMFPPFVYGSIEAYLDEQLDALSLLCWWLAFGLPILATDKDNFDKKVLQNLLRIIAKCYLEIQIMKAPLGKLNIFSYIKAIFIAVFTKSIYDYDLDTINEDIEKAASIETTSTANNHNNPSPTQPLLQSNNYQGYSAPQKLSSYLPFWSKSQDETEDSRSSLQMSSKN